MIRAHAGGYVGRVRAALARSFAETHTPREVAGSFSPDVFITMLPTLGSGPPVFVGLAAVFERISEVAPFASVVVFDPAVKWGVYAASFGLGSLLLGPVEGVSVAGGGGLPPDAGRGVLTRLLVGNLILAVVAAVPSYVIAYRLAVKYPALLPRSRSALARSLRTGFSVGFRTCRPVPMLGVASMHADGSRAGCSSQPRYSAPSSKAGAGRTPQKRGGRLTRL